MRLPLRARVTLVSAALMAVILAGTGVFLHQRLKAELFASVDASLRPWATSAVEELAHTEEGAALDPPPGLEDAFLSVIRPRDGAADLGPTAADLGLTADDLVGLDPPKFLERTVTIAGESTKARILLTPVDADRVLIVGVSVDDQREALARLATLLWIGGPLALALTVGATWLLVGLALRPVESMRIEAAAISASEPGRRLPVPATGDELARLSETLNAMLERLEEALERERRFVGDASHELRTPLANLKMELDLALRRSRTADELERALRSATEETDRLARLSDDLLVLARADQGRLPVRRQPVEVGGLVAGVVELFGSRAANRDVAVEVRVPADLVADVDDLRLRQALGNLLDNAIRHTPAGGEVTVEATGRDGALRLEVRDTGEGFPPWSLPGVFEAFARPDASRTRAEGGAGLGLTIVRAIAQAHGGSAEARNLAGGGAAVVVEIPA